MAPHGGWRRVRQLGTKQTINLSREQNFLVRSWESTTRAANCRSRLGRARVRSVGVSQVKVSVAGLFGFLKRLRRSLRDKRFFRSFVGRHFVLRTAGLDSSAAAPTTTTTPPHHVRMSRNCDFSQWQLLPPVGWCYSCVIPAAILVLCLRYSCVILRYSCVIFALSRCYSGFIPLARYSLGTTPLCPVRLLPLSHVRRLR